MKRSPIYTTGAFLSPRQVTYSNGFIAWIWAVTQFEDDTYLYGKICNPVETAITAEELLLTNHEDSAENICCAGYPDCFCKK